MVTTSRDSVGVGTWTIDPGHAVVEFQARHMMISTVRGRFTGVTGTIQYDEANPANSMVEATIDASSVQSGSEQRDGHLKSPDFFDVTQFPTITFRSTRVVPLGRDRATIYGDLTVRDVTRPVTLDAELTGRGTSPWGQQVIGFAATTSIPRKDWGLSWNVPLEAGGLLVGETIKLVIDAEGILQS